MRTLVFTGKQFEFRDNGDPPPREGMSRLPQRARRFTGLPSRLDGFRPVPAGGNGYKPGKLTDLGPDQCRFTLPNDLMCGAKAKGSWCEEHAGVVKQGKLQRGSA